MHTDHAIATSVTIRNVSAAAYRCFSGVLRGDGRYYGGPVNVTEGGLACQRWSDQYPHRHTFRPAAAPVLTGAGSACRNAGGVYRQPWCYTVEPDVRWQYCNVSVCR